MPSHSRAPVFVPASSASIGVQRPGLSLLTVPTYYETRVQHGVSMDLDAYVARPSRLIIAEKDLKMRLPEGPCHLAAAD